MKYSEEEWYPLVCIRCNRRRSSYYSAVGGKITGKVLCWVCYEIIKGEGKVQ